MKNRKTELDLLRLLALLCVMGLHVQGSVWGSLPLFSPAHLEAAALRQTWAVPVLVMISGRFLLDPKRQVDVKKYVLRTVRAFCFWSAAYQLYYLTTTWPDPDWKGLAAGYVTGAYHLWYLWMLLGLYAVAPLLRKIAADWALTGYYLGLWFGAQCLQYFVRELPWVGTAAGEVLEKMQPQFFMGYTGYFLLGYFLHSRELGRAQRRGLYAAGAACFMISFVGNMVLTWKLGYKTEFFSTYLSPAMILQAAAIYLFFAQELSKIRWGSRMRSLLNRLAELGFGAYLTHALVNEWTTALVGTQRLAARPLIWIPLTTFLVALGSFAAAAVLKKVPVLRKFVT